MNFKNKETGEVLSHTRFVAFVLREAEKEYNCICKNSNWGDLLRAEQISLYCQMYERKIRGAVWEMIPQ